MDIINDVNSIKDKVTKFESTISLKEIYTNKFVILIVVALLLFIFFGYKYGTYNPQSLIVTKLVDAQLEQKKIEYKKLVDEKDAQIRERDIKAGLLQQKLIDSQAKYLSSQKDIEKLKEEMKNAKPPKDESEIRDRMLKLGYPTF